jgi:hypothetical protein
VIPNPPRQCVLDATLCDKGQWFSPGPPVSSSNKTDLHDITEILLKVALNIIIKTQTKLLMKTTYALYAICYNMYYIVGNGEDISIGCI